MSEILNDLRDGMAMVLMGWALNIMPKSSFRDRLAESMHPVLRAETATLAVAVNSILEERDQLCKCGHVYSIHMDESHCWMYNVGCPCQKFEAAEPGKESKVQ